LFSVGNFASYPEVLIMSDVPWLNGCQCRQLLVQNGFLSYCNQHLRNSPDVTLRKYASRVMQKCGLHAE